MKDIKKVGIWMDHSSANVMEIIDNYIITKIVNSETGSDRNSIIVGKDKTHQQIKNQMQLSDYYRILADIILKYDEILLFGPTDAKTELFNLLRKDKQFDDKIIAVKSTDKMTDKQQDAFVWEHFDSK
jgi:hypothetical protein